MLPVFLMKFFENKLTYEHSASAGMSRNTIYSYIYLSSAPSTTYESLQVDILIFTSVRSYLNSRRQNLWVYKQQKWRQYIDVVLSAHAVTGFV